jgi:arylsulfatase A-like enzyme
MKNIILLVVDTLRKKDLVQDEELTPFLNSRKENGAYLERYYSNAAWTVPAHASMFTGKAPSEHGTTTEEMFFNEKNLLVDDLSQDFETIGITENMLLTYELGFGGEFDEYIQVTKDAGGETWREVWEKDETFEDRADKYSYFFKKAISRRDLDSIKGMFGHVYQKYVRSEADYNSGKTIDVFKNAKDFLDSSKRQFLFLNIMPVHAPYTFNEEQRQEFLEGANKDQIMEASQTILLEDYFPEGMSSEILDVRKQAYRSSIKYADKKIERFYRSAPEDTLFIVLGDHGELTGEYELQDTKLIGHHLGTYKELIEVPCWIFGKKIDETIELDQQKPFSHKNIIEIINSIRTGSRPEGNKLVKSEYYGRKGLAEQFNRPIPQGFEKIYNRKSFSLIDNKTKYDLTTDGEYAWPLEDLTETELVEIPDKLSDKALILYGDVLD